jgi:arylsulfatase A-like enzyme
METVDDEILDFSLKFIDKAHNEGKPFFLWLNPTRMPIVTHLSPKYEALRNSQNERTIHEPGIAQLDDIVGSVMQKLKDMGVAADAPNGSNGTTRSAILLAVKR